MHETAPDSPRPSSYPSGADPAGTDSSRARPARRCNADYRWTVPKVAAFLDALAASGSVAEAARTVGMSRQAAYALRARFDGPFFRAAFEAARAEGLKARRVRRTPPPSRWDGPGLAALDRLYAARADTLASQADGDARQVDAFTSQADA